MFRNLRALSGLALCLTNVFPSSGSADAAKSSPLLMRAKVEHTAVQGTGEQLASGQNTRWAAKLVHLDSRPSSRKSLQAPKLVVKQMPRTIVEHSGSAVDDNQILEVWGTQEEVQKKLVSMGISSETVKVHLLRWQRFQETHFAAEGTESAEDEVRTFVNSGPSENRIDLVFMGDGYLESEREKFFGDAQRLSKDLFDSRTFSSYLPLFNVHAVFRPSAQSGIGRGKAANTAYGLYREGNTLRAIFPNNQQALRDSCAMAVDCDYPVVVANDDLYGGLGGEFAITTRSVTSGSVVLRHELGHNFGRVGEEYDGGGYFGANHSSSLSGIGWNKWIDGSAANIKPSPQVALALGWPWKNISTGSFEQKFQSQGKYGYNAIRLSLSGLAGPSAYGVYLDGVPLEEQTLPTEDRSFVDFRLTEPFSKGNHVLEVKALRPKGNEYVSSMTIHEYANDPLAAPDTIGAFPVFGPSRDVRGYRPTDERCLMRNMLHPDFCPVCQENNWRELMGSLKLYDSVAATGSVAEQNTTLEIQPLGLGQFRKLGMPRSPAPNSERVSIRWFRNGTPLEQLNDKTNVSLPDARSGDKVTARLVLESNEIRNDDKGFSKSEITLTIK